MQRLAAGPTVRLGSACLSPAITPNQPPEGRDAMMQQCTYLQLVLLILRCVKFVHQITVNIGKLGTLSVWLLIRLNGYLGLSVSLKRLTNHSEPSYLQTVKGSILRPNSALLLHMTMEMLDCLLWQGSPVIKKNPERFLLTRITWTSPLQLLLITASL